MRYNNTNRLHSKSEVIILDKFKRQEDGFKEAAEYSLRLFLLALLRNENIKYDKCKDLFYIKTYIEQYADQKINLDNYSFL